MPEKRRRRSAADKLYRNGNRQTRDRGTATVPCQPNGAQRYCPDQWAKKAYDMNFVLHDGQA
jgi:hypothetical protein